MRLKPVVASGTVRMAKHDTTLGGGKYQIPGKTVIWMPVHSIHTSAHNWGSDADCYKPVKPSLSPIQMPGVLLSRFCHVFSTAGARPSSLPRPIRVTACAAPIAPPHNGGPAKHARNGIVATCCRSGGWRRGSSMRRLLKVLSSTAAMAMAQLLRPLM